jgi:hypothetical protein
MDRLPQDLRHALRRLTRERGFTAVALLTLAFGIGANAAIFSVIRTVILKPLPSHSREFSTLARRIRTATSRRSLPDISPPWG